MGYRGFQIGGVFAEYDLSKPTIFLQNLVYICRLLYNIYTVFVYQIFETGTLDRHRTGFDQLPSNIGFSLQGVPHQIRPRQYV